MSNTSKILVLIQFSSFLFFAIAGNLFTYSYWLVFQVLGLGIGLWGVLAMKIGGFNIQPEVKNHVNLVARGPYKIIRNPMYAGLLLFFGISVFVNFEKNNLNYALLRLGVYFVLLVVLLKKIYMEETFLKEKFGKEYTSYKQKTYRLIPFIF